MPLKVESRSSPGADAGSGRRQRTSLPAGGRSLSATCSRRRARPRPRPSARRAGRPCSFGPISRRRRTAPAGGDRGGALRQAGCAHLLRRDPAGRHAAGGGPRRGDVRAGPVHQLEGNLPHGEGGASLPAPGREGRDPAHGLGGRDEDPEFLPRLRVEQGRGARPRHDAGGAARATRHPRPRRVPVQHRDADADREPGGPSRAAGKDLEQARAQAIKEAGDPTGVANILAFLASPRPTTCGDDLHEVAPGCACLPDLGLPPRGICRARPGWTV